MNKDSHQTPVRFSLTFWALFRSILFKINSGSFFITTFFVWMLIYSIPSSPIVFEAEAATSSSMADMSKQVREIESQLAIVARKVALLDKKESPIEMKMSEDKVKEKVRVVPFYSQFDDITPANWKKIGCGIASLGMLIDYYKPAVPVDTLLDEGINSGAYITSAGWSHQGLINVAKKYGLTGEPVSLAHLSADAAFLELEKVLAEGPVMASVYYTFTPGHPIPHLVVINDVKDGFVYYNDPAEPSGGGTISIEKFKPAWKERYISIRPI